MAQPNLAVNEDARVVRVRDESASRAYATSSASSTPRFNFWDGNAANSTHNLPLYLMPLGLNCAHFLRTYAEAGCGQTRDDLLSSICFSIDARDKQRDEMLVAAPFGFDYHDRCRLSLPVTTRHPTCFDVCALRHRGGRASHIANIAPAVKAKSRNYQFAAERPNYLYLLAFTQDAARRRQMKPKSVTMQTARGEFIPHHQMRGRRPLLVAFLV